MTQELLVLISGIILFLTPFFGIPNTWKLYIMSGIGILLILIGYRLRYRRAVRDIEGEKSDPEYGFVEVTKPLFTTSDKSEQS